MTFKDDHPELQHLARELTLLRDHNTGFKKGMPQDRLLLFAEAALVLLLLERFLRAILGDAVDDKQTIYNLLQKAVKLQLIRVPWDDQDDGIGRIRDVRNSLLHGSYEKAAAQAGCSSVAAYFGGQFVAEVEALHGITQFIVAQIDPDTGRRWEGPATTE